MKLSVLGAAGATGIPLVEQALARDIASRHSFDPGRNCPSPIPTSMLSKATQPTAQRSPKP
jgi:hypothetical protein